MTVTLIAVGGACGALARYLVDRFIAQHWGSPFPLGTLTVNVTGSAALGALAGATLAGTVPVAAASSAGIGFLGAYTTFSTFTFETLRLLEDGAWRYAIGNIVLSCLLSFAAAAAGYVVVHLTASRPGWTSSTEPSGHGEEGARYREALGSPGG